MTTQEAIEVLKEISKEFEEKQKISFSITGLPSFYLKQALLAFKLAITALENEEKLKARIKELEGQLQKFHNPLQHDHIKDEKQCKICKVLMDTKQAIVDEKN